jgi:hypothetical protein
MEIGIIEIASCLDGRQGNNKKGRSFPVRRVYLPKAGKAMTEKEVFYMN